VAAALHAELQAGSNGAAELSEAITSNGQLHVDLSRLEFADTYGIKALVSVARSGSAACPTVLLYRCGGWPQMWCRAGQLSE
jgi:anti-anti-sigma regulatory factor